MRFANVDACLKPLLLNKVDDRHDDRRLCQLEAQLLHDRSEVRQEFIERFLALPDVEDLKLAVSWRSTTRSISSARPEPRQHLCHTDIGIVEQTDVEAARARLIEAEQEYQRARVDDYVARTVRDSAMVDAHRAGLSSNEISKLLGDMGQANVVRARRRALSRQAGIPGGLLSPADAVRESGLRPREFIEAVRSGRLATVELPDGGRAFRLEDVRQLRSAS